MQMLHWPEAFVPSPEHRDLALPLLMDERDLQCPLGPDASGDHLKGSFLLILYLPETPPEVANLHLGPLGRHGHALRRSRDFRHRKTPNSTKIVFLN